MLHSNDVHGACGCKGYGSVGSWYFYQPLYTPITLGARLQGKEAAGDTRQAIKDTRAVMKD